MQEIGRVHHLQRVEEGRDDGIELVLRGGAAEASEPGLQALTPLEAHHHVGGRVRLEDARDAHDARMLEAGQRARLLEEVRAAPFERLLVALGLRPHAHARVAVAELVGVVFLEGHRGAQGDVLGLVGDAEPARAHHAHDAVGAVENGILRESKATVQDIPPFPCLLLPKLRPLGVAESVPKRRDWVRSRHREECPAADNPDRTCEDALGSDYMAPHDALGSSPGNSQGPRAKRDRDWSEATHSLLLGDGHALASEGSQRVAGAASPAQQDYSPHFMR